MRRLLALGLLLALGGCVTIDQDMPHETLVKDWRDEVIYQIMIDRFEDGDPNNNYNVDYRREGAYHGGDWQGLIDRLDYIETLGVTTLWISPVVKNVEEDAGFFSYHGYWTQDFVNVNPHFGDLAKLQELVNECHARNIKVVLDIVTNHMGQLFFYDVNRNGVPDVIDYGGGGTVPNQHNEDEIAPLRRISEWDPEYDGRGIQGWTSLGENGLAPLVWAKNPEVNKMPPEPAEFHNPNWFNRRGRVTVWENNGGHTYYEKCRANGADDATCRAYQTRKVREQEILGDFPGGLKDLATDKPEVQQGLIRAFQHWIEVADFDGFRIDTLKHQETQFFDVFAPAMRRYAASLGKKQFLMFGEAFDAQDELLGDYTQGQGVDSVFYFSHKYWVFDGIFGQGGATRGAQELFELRKAKRADGKARYNDQPKENGPTDEQGKGLTAQQLLVNFIDNHDVPRFLFSYEEPRRLRNALSYLLTMDGIPCVYYGTEQDFAGGPDPSNREDMWHTDFATDGETFQFMRRLIAMRKRYSALRRGSMRFVMTSTDACASGKNCASESGLIAFERVDGANKALVLINAHDSYTTHTRNASGDMQTSFAANSTVVDVWNNQQFKVDGQGRLHLTIEPRSFRVLVPQGQQ